MGPFINYVKAGVEVLWDFENDDKILLFMEWRVFFMARKRRVST